MGAPADSGAGALLSREILAGFPPGNEPGGRFETRLGYGLAALGGRFTGTPELGFALSNTHRDHSLGWRLSSGPNHSGTFALHVGGTRRESLDRRHRPEHSVEITLRLRR